MQNFERITLRKKFLYVKKWVKSVLLGLGSCTTISFIWVMLRIKSRGLWPNQTFNLCFPRFFSTVSLLPKHMKLPVEERR